MHSTFEVFQVGVFPSDSQTSITSHSFACYHSLLTTFHVSPLFILPAIIKNHICYFPLCVLLKNIVTFCSIWNKVKISQLALRTLFSLCTNLTSQYIITDLIQVKSLLIFSFIVYAVHSITQGLSFKIKFSVSPCALIISLLLCIFSKHFYYHPFGNTASGVRGIYVTKHRYPAVLIDSVASKDYRMNTREVRIRLNECLAFIETQLFNRASFL